MKYDRIKECKMEKHGGGTQRLAEALWKEGSQHVLIRGYSVQHLHYNVRSHVQHTLAFLKAYESRIQQVKSVVLVVQEPIANHICGESESHPWCFA